MAKGKLKAKVRVKAKAKPKRNIRNTYAEKVIVVTAKAEKK